MQTRASPLAPAPLSNGSTLGHWLKPIDLIQIEIIVSKLINEHFSLSYILNVRLRLTI
jgi:hypothetical protein